MPENPEVPEETPPLSMRDLFSQIISGGQESPKVEPSSDIRDLASSYNQFVTAFVDQGFTRKEAISISSEFFLRMHGKSE